LAASAPMRRAHRDAHVGRSPEVRAIVDARVAHFHYKGCGAVLPRLRCDGWPFHGPICVERLTYKELAVLNVFNCIRLLALCTIVLHACAIEAAELKVFTSRAIATVLERSGPEFERTTGHKLTVVSGFSPVFVKQIRDGEPFDLVVAPPSTIDALIKDSHVVADTRTHLVRSGFGVAVRAGAPKPDISSVEAFKRALLNARSIGYIQTAGVPQLIDRLGLADAIKAKTTIPSTDTVNELVAKGDIELGVLVITQIVTTPGLELAGPLPPDIQYHITFTAGVSAASKSPEAARELIRFLTGPAVVPVVSAQGMEPAR
jgi:molybdate transport system substrate-binding protein